MGKKANGDATTNGVPGDDVDTSSPLEPIPTSVSSPSASLKGSKKIVKKKVSKKKTSSVAKKPPVVKAVPTDVPPLEEDTTASSKVIADDADESAAVLTEQTNGREMVVDEEQEQEGDTSSSVNEMVKAVEESTLGAVLLGAQLIARQFGIYDGPHKRHLTDVSAVLETLCPLSGIVRRDIVCTNYPDQLVSVLNPQAHFQWRLITGYQPARSQLVPRHVIVCSQTPRSNQICGASLTHILDMVVHPDDGFTVSSKDHPEFTMWRLLGHEDLKTCRVERHALVKGFGSASARGDAWFERIDDCSFFEMFAGIHNLDQQSFVESCETIDMEPYTDNAVRVRASQAAAFTALYAYTCPYDAETDTYNVVIPTPTVFEVAFYQESTSMLLGSVFLYAYDPVTAYRTARKMFYTNIMFDTPIDEPLVFDVRRCNTTNAESGFLFSLDVDLDLIISQCKTTQEKLGEDGFTAFSDISATRDHEANKQAYIQEKLGLFDVGTRSFVFRC